MKGSVLMGGILAAAAMMGGGLWYATQVGHYEEVSALGEVVVAGESRAVEAYQGLDGDSSPLKLRACFEVDWPYTPDPTYKAVAAPLTTPSWFDCFDAAQIGADLASGAATAILAQENAPFGFSRFIAHYPDGRAFMWRQLNVCGERHFAGEAMPADCPAPDAETAAKRVMIDPNSDLFTLNLTGLMGGDLDPILLRGTPKVAAASTGEYYHACFETQSSLAFLSENYEIADASTPVAPRGNFPCFDANALQEDLTAGEAVGFVGQRNIIDGFDRIVAVYPDGRAFAWHQQGQN